MPCRLFYCHLASQLDPKPLSEIFNSLKRLSDIMLIILFPHTDLCKFKLLSHNTTICCKVKVTFPVTKLGGYGVVDVGSK